MARAKTYWVKRGAQWQVSTRQSVGACFRVVWSRQTNEPTLDTGDISPKHAAPGAMIQWQEYLRKFSEIAQWRAHVDVYAGRMAKATVDDLLSRQPPAESIAAVEKDIMGRPLTALEYRAFCRHYARVVQANMPSPKPPATMWTTTEQSDGPG